MRKASGDSRLGRAQLALWHAVILAVVFAVWYGLTTPGFVDADYANRIAFFFGRPLQVIKVVIEWFTSGKIYPHLAITLWETRLRSRSVEPGPSTVYGPTVASGEIEQ